MLRRNLVANYLGQGWAALMGLAFVPLYIMYLGIEAYALIGVFALLQASLTALDVGMTPTISREMARYTGGGHTAQSIRDLLRSVEYVAAGIALLVVAGLWAGSRWLATDWLRPDSLSSGVVRQAFGIMGAVIALRFVEGIYRSAVVGLQRQVLFNVFNAGLATARGLGAVGVLAWLSPTIGAFFIWQGLISIVTLSVLAGITYYILPRADRPGKLSVQALRGVWRFAGGMFGITILAMLLTQVDKILLSKLLPLSDFGYYTLAATVAGGLYMLISPITTAWYPKLCELRARNDVAALTTTYHKGAQLVTVIVGSAAIVVMLFSHTLLHLWTQDVELASRTASLVSLLVLGNLFNGLMWIPYQTQLAHGWTGLALRINIVAVLVIVPAILWATPRWGAEGAAWAWVGLNAGYLLIGVHFMYRRILMSEKWRWYRQDMIQPLLSAFLIVLLIRWLTPEPLGTITQIAVLASASVAALLGASLVAPSVRQSALQLIRSSVLIIEAKRP